MTSPWIKRFDDAFDDSSIQAKALLIPEPKRGLNGDEIEVATHDLRAALQEIYIPTKNCIEIMKSLMSKSVSFSKEYYPTKKDYLKEVYNPREEAVFPSCLTGPAGVGKTQLIRALTRVMPEKSIVEPGEGHNNFVMESMWTIKTRKLVPMLKSLLPNDTGRIYVDDLITACRRVTRTNGIALIVIDELQAFSASSSASSSVTSAILEFSKLGVPLVYACNYSLCHKFMRRNDHDKHRLLGSPLILLPDARGSQDWREFVDVCCLVSDGVISLPDEASISRLYSYCAGLKRLAVELICLAYKLARNNGHKKATIDHVEAAYASSSFVTFRKDVEILLKQEIEGVMIKSDLWCPFELPKTKQQEFTEGCKVSRQEKIAEAALKSSLSVREMKNLNLVKTNIKKGNERPSIKLEHKPSKPKISTELLIANAKKYSEKIKNDK